MPLYGAARTGAVEPLWIQQRHLDQGRAKLADARQQPVRLFRFPERREGERVQSKLGRTYVWLIFPSSISASAELRIGN